MTRKNPSTALRCALLPLLLAVRLVPAGACGPPPGPTDNPIASYYGADAYPWTDNIHWGNVYNIRDYGGVADGVTDNTVAFGRARDAASAAGGGIVYFPATGNADTYYFADSLYLKDGIALRGDTPTGITEGKTEGYAPPSKLVFPPYDPVLSGNGGDVAAFKHIYTTSPRTDSNLGVVNLDINRAGINFTETDAVKYTDAYDPNNYTGRNFIVFGVRDNNAAYASGAPGVPAGVPQPWQNAWQRYPFAFACNIEIITGPAGNALVANNRLNDLSRDGLDDSYDQPGYIVRPASGTNTVTLSAGQANFDYANVYGISVNGAYCIQYHNNMFGTNDPADPRGPYTPFLFWPGHVIRDNWIYHDEGQAIVASGTGLTITGNVVKDKETTKSLWVRNDGQRQPTGSAFTTRACLMGGQDIDVENNMVEAFPWLVTGGPYHTNDGESLLWDNTSTLVNGWIVRNNTVNGLVSNFKSKDIRNVAIENNTWDTAHSGNVDGAAIWEEADLSAGSPYTINNVHIDNNANVPGSIRLLGSAGGGNNSVIGNASNGPNHNLDYSLAAEIDIRDNLGFTLIGH